MLNPQTESNYKNNNELWLFQKKNRKENKLKEKQWLNVGFWISSTEIKASPHLCFEKLSHELLMSPFDGPIGHSARLYYFAYFDFEKQSYISKETISLLVVFISGANVKS